MVVVPAHPPFWGRGPGQGPTADALEHCFCHRSLVTALGPDPVLLQVSGLHPAQVCSPRAVAPGPGRLAEAGPSDPTEDPRTGQRKPLLGASVQKEQTPRLSQSQLLHAVPRPSSPGLHSPSCWEVTREV